MKRLGLLGANISHSKSKKMYEELLKEKVNYTLFDYETADEIPSLGEFFSNIEGLSITAPYKKHFLNSVSMEANISKLGAINCIKKRGDKFYATNTDFLAVKNLIQKSFFDFNIIILGDGSMARITKVILSEFGLDYQQYSRKVDGDISKLDLSGIQKKSVIINTCARAFIFSGQLPLKCTFWDYNYAHEAHEQYFLSNDQHYLDGLSLLKLQAKFALDFWENN
ncbi:hypothetical protein A9Q84_21350 [Halobacteriovorax marinus]|uniref:Shikimate dehydrogenase substrate binding N-terminal domain-containing protein n=1 Tax=Halobacteriovorax marinus TaxID=97084 RepID=A0A1Y5F836_9BACT|nr:hypothetical protein A9Q84_21350 [Halobacteriovorax marinus]